MESQGKRIFLAAVLALGVMFLWQYIFPPPKPAATTPTPDGVVVPTAPKVQRYFGTLLDGTMPSAPAAELPGGEEIVRTFDKPQLEVKISSANAAITSWRLLSQQFQRSEQKGQMLPAPSFAINFIRSTVAIPPDAVWNLELPAGKDEFTYVYKTADLSVKKTFKIVPETYSVNMTIELANIGARDLKQRLAVSVAGHQDPKGETESGMGGRVARDWRAACLKDEEVYAHTLKDLQKPRELANVNWVGFRHPYMLVSLASKPNKNELISCSNYAIGTDGDMIADLEFPEAILRPGDPPVTRQLTAFLGPKFYDKLEAVDTTAGFNTGIHSAVDFGWLAIIARPLLWLLQAINSFVHTWGVSIILLTFLVKLATLYWTTSSMRSMKAMANLKPQMDALQAKHGEDKQRIQTEMMALYKANGVNPIAGCLPMLLQMPIWFALYSMLSKAGELYHARFLWMPDLTAPDPYFIIPVILCGTMFMQSKLQPATGDSAQQKMMQYGLPLVFGVMSFFFPSGLSVYILTNTVLTILHSLYMNKKYPAPTPTKPAPTKGAPAPADATYEAELAASAGAAVIAGASPVTKAPAPTAKRRGKRDTSN